MYIVYIPQQEHPSTADIAAGSGIIGTEHGDGTCTIWFEGNLYGASNLTRWIERVECAAGRMLERYPSVAKRTVPAAAVRRVGTFEPVNRSVVLEDIEAVRAWSGEPIEGVVHTSSQVRPARG